MEENLKIPNHVAIILDGNGRWAKAKGMPRNYGHVQGAKTVEVICEEAYRMGIQYLTVYAFSTENWNRPQDEVDALMKLLRNYMKTCLKTAEKNRMCVRVLGDKTRLDQDIQTRIAELEEATKNNHCNQFLCLIGDIENNIIINRHNSCISTLPGLSFILPELLRILSQGKDFFFDPVKLSGCILRRKKIKCYILKDTAKIVLSLLRKGNIIFHTL